MKYNIQLLSFNNYFNRRVLKYDTLAEYEDFIVGSVDNCNFEMKDGIRSKIIINSSFVPTQPDYILVIERNKDGTNSDVFSRWFIIDSNLVRGNQYEFSVKRDICVDFYDLMMNSSFFVERGYLDGSNDLIFNDEGQKFSQIKKSQKLLRDETYGPWIVGYVPRELELNSDETIKASVFTDEADITVADITLWDYYTYTNNYVYTDNTDNPYTFGYILPIENHVNSNTKYQQIIMTFDAKNKISASGSSGFNSSAYYEPFDNAYSSGVIYKNYISGLYLSQKTNLGLNYNSTMTFNDAVRLMTLAIRDQILYNLRNNALTWSQMINCYKTHYSPDNETYNELFNNLAGKSIKDLNTGKIYMITVEEEAYTNGYTYVSGDSNYETLHSLICSLLPNSITNAYGSTTKQTNPPISNDALGIGVNLKRAKITLDEIATVQVDIPQDDSVGTIYRTHLIDAPYDMFAIPFNSNLAIKDGLSTIYPNVAATLSLANSIVAQLGAEKVYDLQILPYCPVRQYIKSDGTFDVTDATQKQVREITLGGGTVNYMFWCSKSNQENIILLDPENDLEPYKIEIDDLKKSYNVDMYRLCSPNFASVFEFSPAQNGGVDYFTMSYTYKPYNPYIRVRPNFKRMFGNDYKDARGLILQGDFSLPQVTNAWTEYELRNKNYLNVFNREIQSLDLQQKVGQQTDWFKAIAGTLTGGAAGLIAGGYGGAGVGSALAGVGGALDITINQRLREDVWTKAQALFTYQLDNIKALPNTLANVGCLIVDNPLIPILEYYTASNDEIDAYDRKIKYYGMSVMKVGSLAEFLNPSDETFIQGYLLRLLPPDGVNEEADNHLAEELSDEISKGLYIGS